MSGFSQRLRENFFEARGLCSGGNHATTLPVRADDFCAIHRILYRCFKEESERGQKMEEAADALDTAVSDLEDMESSLDKGKA